MVEVSMKRYCANSDQALGANWESDCNMLDRRDSE